MGFGLIAAGFVFLFNPMYNIIDVLPDFIGALLIYWGTAKIAVLNEDIRSARTKTLYFSLVEAAKLLSIIFLSSADGTRYLLLGVVFGIIECICFIPAMIDLFEGIEHMGMKYDSSSVNRTYVKKSGKRAEIKEYSALAKKTILAFFVFRIVFAVLPEITELRMNEYSGVVSSIMIDYTTFKPMLYFFATILVLAFSVYYLKVTLSFWMGIKRDEPFVQVIKDKYDSFTQTNRFYFSAKKLSGIFSVAIIASVSIFTLAPDRMWFFPTSICALIVGLLIVFGVRENVKKSAVFASTAGLSAIVSFATIYMNAEFREKFRLDEIFKTLFPDATSAYFKVSAVYTLERLLLAVAFAALVLGLRKTAVNLIPKAINARCMSNMNNEVLRGELTAGIKKRTRLISIFSVITVAYSAALPYIYFLTGTIYEANLNDFKEGDIDIGLYLGCSYSLYFAIFTLLVIATSLLIYSCRSYVKREICDPICDWGLDRER